MKKMLFIILMLTAVLALTACGKNRAPQDEDAPVITDGDCDSSTWDDLCLARDELSDVYQEVLKKKDSGEIPETLGGFKTESLLSEAADLINEFAEAHRNNYNALDAREKCDRMIELTQLLEGAAGT